MPWRARSSCKLARAIAAGAGREIATARALFKQHKAECLAAGLDSNPTVLAWAKMELRYLEPGKAREVTATLRDRAHALACAVADHCTQKSPAAVARPSPTSHTHSCLHSCLHSCPHSCQQYCGPECR